MPAPHNVSMGSIGKIVVLGIVIAVAWFGWRWWQRVEAERLNRSRPPATPPRDDRPPSVTASKVFDDMRRCPVCDDFVSINARRCERPTCPRG